LRTLAGRNLPHEHLTQSPCSIAG